MYISRLLTQPLQQLKLTLKTSPQVPQTFLLFYISAFIVLEVFIFDQVETPPITTGFVLRIGRLLIFFSAERLTQLFLHPFQRKYSMESPFVSCQASSYTLTTSTKYNRRGVN